MIGKLFGIEGAVPGQWERRNCLMIISIPTNHFLGNGKLSDKVIPYIISLSFFVCLFFFPVLYLFFGQRN